MNRKLKTRPKASHWRRDEPQFFQFLGLSEETLRDPQPLFGVAGSVLSRDRRTGATTYLITLPIAWTAVADSAEGTLEVLVLEGRVQMEGDLVGAGGYLYLPQGAASVELASPSGAVALVFWNPSMPLFPPPLTRPRVMKTWREPWQQQNVNRPVEHGTVFKSLRLPDFSGDFEGGPGGFLRLYTHTPGNHDFRQHVHHDCWEEMFILRGTMFQPERGVVGPGTCLANPQEFWHAPWASHGGCVMITHTDGPMGPWGVREYPNSEEMLETYFESTSFARPEETRSWEEMSEWKRWLEMPAYQEWQEAPDWEAWSDEVGREAASKARAVNKRRLFDPGNDD